MSALGLLFLAMFMPRSGAAPVTLQGYAPQVRRGSENIVKVPNGSPKHLQKIPGYRFEDIPQPTADIPKAPRGNIAGYLGKAPKDVGGADLLRFAEVEKEEIEFLKKELSALAAMNGAPKKARGRPRTVIKMAAQRPRGRPRKIADPSATVKRPRGRRRKIVDPLATVKRPRGRPRKIVDPSTVVKKPPGRPGRPAKVKVPEATWKVRSEDREQSRAAQAPGMMNILGTKLEPCSKPGMAVTGFTESGSCEDQDNDKYLDYPICIEMKDDFCAVTGQADWCHDQKPCKGTDGFCSIQNWCVSLWGYTKYIRKAGGCEALDIVCDATNIAALHIESSYLGDKLRTCLEAKCGIQPAEVGPSLPTDASSLLEPGEEVLGPAPVASLSASSVPRKGDSILAVVAASSVVLLLAAVLHARRPATGDAAASAYVALVE